MRQIPSFNQTIARRLTPWFLRWGVSANQVTLLSLAAGGAGALFLLEGEQTPMVVGSLFFLLANLLDECDGSVARATGKANGFGSWLDTVVGCIVHMVFFASVGWGLFRRTGQPHWATLGAAVAVGVLVSTAAFILSQIWARGRQGWLHPDPPRGAGTLEAVEAARGTLRSDFSLVVLLAAVAGWLPWLLWGALVGTFLFWIPGDLRLAVRTRQRLSRWPRDF